MSLCCAAFMLVIIAIPALYMKSRLKQASEQTGDVLSINPLETQEEVRVINISTSDSIEVLSRSIALIDDTLSGITCKDIDKEAMYLVSRHMEQIAKATLILADKNNMSNNSYVANLNRFVARQ